MISLSLSLSVSNDRNYLQDPLDAQLAKMLQDGLETFVYLLP